MKNILTIIFYLMLINALSAQHLEEDLKQCFNQIFTTKDCAFDIKYQLYTTAENNAPEIELDMKYKVHNNKIRCEFEENIIIKTSAFFLQLNKAEKYLIFTENDKPSEVNILEAISGLDLNNLKYTSTTEANIIRYKVFDKKDDDKILAEYKIDINKKQILSIKMYKSLPQSSMIKYTFSNYQWDIKIPAQSFNYSTYVVKVNGKFKPTKHYKSYELLNMGGIL